MDCTTDEEEEEEEEEGVKGSGKRDNKMLVGMTAFGAHRGGAGRNTRRLDFRQPPVHSFDEFRVPLRTFCLPANRSIQ